MDIFFTWLILSFVVAYIGSDRKIGFGGSLFISLIFSPLIGLIFTLLSKTNVAEKYRESLLQTQRSQQEVLQRMSKSQLVQKNSIADEIEKLQSLKKNNVITEDEFVLLKNKIIEKNIDFEEENIDNSENTERRSEVNKNPNYENQNLKQEKYNSFTVFYIVAGIIIFLIITLNTCENKSSNNNANTASEITIDTSATLSNIDIETNAIEENILKNFSYEDIARYAIANSMQEPASIVNSQKKDNYYYVAYIRPSDSQKFEYKVKFEGQRIIWGALDGRWQDTEYDEKLSFEEKENKLNIITTYSDGSEGIKAFIKEN